MQVAETSRKISFYCWLVFLSNLSMSLIEMQIITAMNSTQVVNGKVTAAVSGNCMCIAHVHTPSAKSLYVYTLVS